MADDVSPERVATIASAARVPLESAAAARVANAVAPTLRRFAAENVSYAFETEPASFIAIARRDFAQ